MKVELPARKLSNPMSIESALDLRETKREFSGAPLSLQHLGQLLWAAQGKREGTEKLTTPSAGAQYPLSILLVASNVSGAETGIYRYNKSSHALEQVRRGEFNRRLGEAAVDYRPPAAFVLGSEAEGLSSAWSTDDVTAITLPMLGRADSLNVSATAAVLFYEALRQRS